MAEKTSEQPSYDINEIIEDLTHAVEVSTAHNQTPVGKLLFLIEQLQLTLESPQARRWVPKHFNSSLVYQR